jgi:hypothetical protein
MEETRGHYVKQNEPNTEKECHTFLVINRNSKVHLIREQRGIMVIRDW